MAMNLYEAVVAMTGLLVALGLPLALAALSLRYKQRRLRMIHETIARLAERGLPVPPELLAPPASARNAGLRGGMVLIGLALGLVAFLAEVGGPWSVGFIPGTMGLALVASWAIERRSQS
jgi:uncharacterized protein DUF6249